MGDIEDLDTKAFGGPKTETSIRVRSRKKQGQEDVAEPSPKSEFDSELPWRHSIYVKTWVCFLSFYLSFRDVFQSF